MALTTPNTCAAARRLQAPLGRGVRCASRYRHLLAFIASFTARRTAAWRPLLLSLSLCLCLAFSLRGASTLGGGQLRAASAYWPTCVSLGATLCTLSRLVSKWPGAFFAVVVVVVVTLFFLAVVSFHSFAVVVPKWRLFLKFASRSIIGLPDATGELERTCSAISPTCLLVRLFTFLARYSVTTVDCVRRFTRMRRRPFKENVMWKVTSKHFESTLRACVCAV